MAEADGRRQGYPVIPAKNWWDLRKRWQSNLPRAKVDAEYLRTVLGVDSARWARTLVSYLTTLGLIDDQGKPTELANRWRHDDEYRVAAHTILEKVFPHELLDALPCSDADRADVTRWFTRNARLGDKAAGRTAAFYMLLCQADPSQQDRPAAASAEARPARTRAQESGTRRRSTRAQPAAQSPNGQVEQPPAIEPQAPTRTEPTRRLSPDLHLNFQIHIAADTGPHQIDAIFASMARHLRDLQVSE